MRYLDPRVPAATGTHLGDSGLLRLEQGPEFEFVSGDWGSGVGIWALASVVGEGRGVCREDGVKPRWARPAYAQRERGRGREGERKKEREGDRGRDLDRQSFQVHEVGSVD